MIFFILSESKYNDHILSETNFSFFIIEGCGIIKNILLLSKKNS